MVQIELLFFAKSRELASLNKAQLQLDKNQLTGHEMLEIILTNYPK